MKSQLIEQWKNPTDYCLHVGDVHVWRVSLDQPLPVVKRLEEWLSEDEQRRAIRYHFPEHRDRFVVCHAALRAIISRYLNRPSREIEFGYGAQGKPYLNHPQENIPLHFNLSHSHNLALIAVTLQREIGVDLEYIRPDFIPGEIAERFFSPAENEKLRTLPASEQRLAFFHCYTRKEAFIKARGDGLTCPLDQFDVEVMPGRAAALLRTCWDPQEASRWSMANLAPGPGYVGALVVEGELGRLSCWQWEI